nr:MAG TPA_asm: hypothetical protein [Caudoviricetes sp.]
MPPSLASDELIDANDQFGVIDLHNQLSITDITV